MPKPANRGFEALEVSNHHTRRAARIRVKVPMRSVSSLSLLLIATLASAQINKPYGDKIKEYTTEPFFLTPLVDHVPQSKRIPAPDAILGHIVGAPNVLDYASDIHRYFRALEKASPRIRVMSMGKSEEGREMIVAFISDEANLKRLDDIARLNGRIGDPRTIKSDADADDLIKQTLPIYWATGGMHAPETGPPEMLAELAYRMVASEEPYIKDIRKNEIVMLTPVLDVDGRERVVDLYRYRKANKGKPRIPLVYWGHYVAHDDNRDALTFRLSLSQSMMKSWLQYHPTVLHDLHESVPLLYISTGTGPYNAWLDPIVVSEWQSMAYNEIEQFTKLGVPGVWTHNYYDGWAASYGFYVANGHNGIGRFYETFSAGDADTGVRSTGSASTRDWYRPNPPFPKVRWSIRDNVNLSESGVLMAMHSVALEKDRFLHNYYLKSKRSVAKAKTEGPVAYVIAPPAAGGQFRLSDLQQVMDRQGVEIHKLTTETTTKDGKFPAGSLVVRMDQPFSRMADMMLDQQYYKASDPASYDDTGWQLGPLFNLNVTRATDPTLLSAKMSLEPYKTPTADVYPSVGKARVAIVHTWNDTQDEGWARLAFENAHVPYTYVSVHELRDTYDLKSKYDVILFPQTGGSAQSIVKGVTQADGPIPWKATQEYPNLGGPDSADDIRGGIELSGMANLQKFVRDGGSLVCIGNTCRLPIDYGLTSGVSVTEHPTLRAPGGVYRVDKTGTTSPLLSGFGESTGVYFNSFSCVTLDAVAVGRGGRRGGAGSGANPDRASGRGSLTDPDVIQGRPPYEPKEQPGDTPENDRRPPATDSPKVLLRFSTVDKLLMSGMIEHGEEMAGKPALVDCTDGKGHIYLFSFNPFWRGETVGSYDFVFNAIRESTK